MASTRIIEQDHGTYTGLVTTTTTATTRANSPGRALCGLRPTRHLGTVLLAVAEP